MLDSQVIMNLLSQLPIGVDLMGHSSWVGEGFTRRAGWSVWATLSASALRSETNEFHKRLSVLV